MHTICDPRHPVHIELGTAFLGANGKSPPTARDPCSFDGTEPCNRSAVSTLTSSLWLADLRVTATLSDMNKYIDVRVVGIASATVNFSISILECPHCLVDVLLLDDDQYLRYVSGMGLPSPPPVGSETNIHDLQTGVFLMQSQVLHIFITRLENDHTGMDISWAVQYTPGVGTTTSAANFNSCIALYSFNHYYMLDGRR